MVIVYVIEGIETNKRYVGITNDLGRRLREHRSKQTKGGQIIGTFKLLHTEEVEDYKEARIREKFLKTGAGRKFLDERCPRIRSAEGG